MEYQPLTTVEDQLYRSPSHRAVVTSVGLWCPLSPSLVDVTCGGGWLVTLPHGLNLSTGCAGSEASWEVQAKVVFFVCLFLS